MLSLRVIEKDLLAEHIGNGNVVADFTMGNGNDTLWLAQRVGTYGRVYAFDIQEDALKNTEKLLAEKGCLEQCTLIHDSHHRLAEYIKEPIDAGIFNLGFLPGGDKRVTTLRETTLPAIEAAINAVKPGGCLLIAIYPGHEEGCIEGQLICEMLAKRDQREFSAYRFNVLNAPTSPYFVFIEFNPKYKKEDKQ